MIDQPGRYNRVMFLSTKDKKMQKKSPQIKVSEKAKNMSFERGYTSVGCGEQQIVALHDQSVV